MEYDFDIYYRPGAQNRNADALLRMPLDGPGLMEMPSVEEVICDNYLPVCNLRSGARRSAEMFHGINATRYTNLYRFLSEFTLDPIVTSKNEASLKVLPRGNLLKVERFIRELTIIMAQEYWYEIIKFWEYFRWCITIV